LKIYFNRPKILINEFMLNRAIFLIVWICFGLSPITAQAYVTSIDEAVIEEYFEVAAKYAVLEMRPTMRFQNARLERWRMDGNRMRGRVTVEWLTLFKNTSQTTIVDVWIEEKSDGKVYLVHYELFSDSHRLPITLPRIADVYIKVN